MLEKNVIIVNKLGLHARAAARLVQLAASFDSQLTVQKESQQVDAKSIMSLMLLAASKGTPLTISAEGRDQQTALNACCDLINTGFGEAE